MTIDMNDVLAVEDRVLRLYHPNGGYRTVGNDPGLSQVEHMQAYIAAWLDEARAGA